MNTKINIADFVSSAEDMTFEELENGDIFILGHGQEVYMKVDLKSISNTIQLKNGFMDFFNPKDKVTRLKQGTITRVKIKEC
jgi:hypothetical protein